MAHTFRRDYTPSNRMSKRYQIVSGDVYEEDMDYWVSRGHKTNKRARQTVGKQARAYDKRQFKRELSMLDK